MRIRNERVRDLSERTYSQLITLTHDGWDMRKELIRGRGAGIKDHRAIYIEDNGVVLAWGLVFKCILGGGNVLYIFTHPNYRRQGLGTKVIKRALQIRKNISVAVHDEQSYLTYLPFEDRLIFDYHGYNPNISH